jgi:hypothetical protein
MTRYLSVTEYARKHGRPRATVKRWCQAALIPGVVRIGNQFGIPADSALPVTRRGRPPLTDPAAQAAARRVTLPDA